MSSHSLALVYMRGLTTLSNICFINVVPNGCNSLQLSLRAQQPYPLRCTEGSSTCTLGWVNLYQKFETEKYTVCGILILPTKKWKDIS